MITSPPRHVDDPSPDAALVARARDGDLVAFEALYRRHVGHVHAICVRLTARRDDAEDRTQDAFLRAWQRLGSFRGEAAFATWLHRLTVNVVLDARRASLRRALEHATDITEDDAAAPPRVDPGARVDLERAIGELPDGARIVFVLHEVEGFGHAEIAQMCGIRPGTSKAQLHRARRLLKRTLGAQHG